MPLLATEEDRPTSKDPEIVYWDNYLNNEKEIIAPDQIVIQEHTLDASDLVACSSTNSIVKVVVLSIHLSLLKYNQDG
jgi:hypothetical protein